MNRSTQFSFRLFLWMFYSRKLENRINWIHVRRNEEERNDGEMKGANIHPKKSASYCYRNAQSQGSDFTKDALIDSLS